MNDTLLTKQEVMEHLHISRKTFEGLVNNNELPLIKITPYKRYVRLSHLNQWLDKNTKNKPIQTKLEKDDKDYKWKPIFK